MFKCTVCGYIHDGDTAPDKCPKCNAPKDKFIQLEAQIADKVRRSRFTNDLHMELKIILDRVVDLSEQGILDDLDPSCVKIFKEAKAAGIELGQKIKAELQGHMNKEKWG